MPDEVITESKETTGEKRKRKTRSRRPRREKKRREEWFAAVGREQLTALLEEGLDQDSYLLDVGCGTLRCGQWIIPLLKPGHYCGIEPVPERVKAGLERLEPEMIALKKPRFDHNTEFDFSVFDVEFTHFVARSIWSHASKQQIESMLDGVAKFGAPGAVMLASFRPTGPNAKNDYTGKEWKGKSHDSAEPGIVAHSVQWVREACEARGLIGEISTRGPVKKNGQVWAAVRKEGGRPGLSKHDRAARLVMQLKHNIRTMKFTTKQLVDQLELQA